MCDSLEVLPKTLKLCQTNCPKYIHDNFFLRHWELYWLRKTKNNLSSTFFPTNGQITSSTTRLTWHNIHVRSDSLAQCPPQSERKTTNYIAYHFNHRMQCVTFPAHGIPSIVPILNKDWARVANVKSTLAGCLVFACVDRHAKPIQYPIPYKWGNTAFVIVLLRAASDSFMSNRNHISGIVFIFEAEKVAACLERNNTR